METRGRPLAVLAVLACASPLAAAMRDEVRRDVEGYAVASCLIAQDSPYLKDQGDGWAANIVQRPAFDPDLFGALNQAVRTEVRKAPMAQVMVESPPMTLKPLPIQFCSEIVDRPAVRAAIERTIRARSRARR